MMAQITQGKCDIHKGEHSTITFRCSTYDLGFLLIANFYVRKYKSRQECIYALTIFKFLACWNTIDSCEVTLSNVY